MPRCAHPVHRLRELYPARDYVSGDLFAVSECQECGLRLTIPAPDEERLAAYYPSGYHASTAHRRFPAPVEALQRLLYAYRARAVERLAGGRPGRVLDVGCGPGHLLGAFRRRGWEVQGTELTEAAAAHAREALAIPVHVGEWKWADGSFDAITLWHVLEHWSDPRRVLEDARRLLRRGGVLMVGVPNAGSAEARVAREGWFHLDVPRHLVHLTPEWLARELAELGFEVGSRSFVAPEYDAFSFVQSTLNRLGFRHNLLYDALRGRAARLLGRSGVLQLAGSVAVALPLAMVSLPATAVLALAGQGSSMTVYAVRV